MTLENSTELSEGEYRALFEEAADGMFVADQEGKFIEVNASVLSMIGHDQEGIVGLPIYDIIRASADGVAFKPLMMKIEELPSGQAVITEQRVHRKDGTSFLAETTLKVLSDGRLLGTIRDISERKRQEDALLQSENLLRAVIENSLDSIALLRPDGQVAYVSPSVKRIAGYDPQQLIGRNGFELVHAEHRARAIKDIQQLMRDPAEPTGGEFLILSKDGGWRWVEGTSRNMISNPAVQAIVVNWRDITERKEKEEQLRQGEAKYRTLVEQVPAISFITALDKAATLLYVSPQIEQFLGYSQAELMSTPGMWATVLHPDDTERVTAQVSRFEASLEEHMSSEFRVLARDGRVSWIDLKMQMVRDASGLPLFRQGVAFDITERELAVDALRGAEQLLRTVVNNAPITVFAIDSQGVFTLSEGKGLQPAGLKPGENVGLSALDLYGSLPVVEVTGAVSTGAAVIRRVLAGETIEGVTELRGRYFENRFIPIRDTNDQVIGLVGVANDFTERKRAEDQREQIYQQVLATRNRLQSLSRRLFEAQEVERRKIARDLHDEMGQLLTGLKMSLERASRLRPDYAKDSLAEPLALVSELIALVRDISLDLRPAMLDDLGLMPGLLWLLDRYMAKTHVQVAFNHNGLDRRFPREVETAAYRIVQEGLTNIARYAHVGEAKVRLWASEETLWVQIDDQGGGFDLEEALAGETGGLHGMQERAFLLGGQLTVDSSPGAGTRITAELPLRQGPDIT